MRLIKRITIVLLITLAVLVTASCGIKEKKANRDNIAEEVQSILSNADEIWFEEPAITIEGHVIVPRDRYREPVFENRTSGLDYSEHIFNVFKGIKLSEFAVSEEYADNKPIKVSMALSAEDSLCRVILGTNEDGNDSVLSFVLEDGSFYSIEEDDNNSFSDINNAISMTQSVRDYSRVDTGGEAKLYNARNEEILTSSWFSAYLKSVFEATVNYGEQEKTAEGDFYGKVVFKDVCYDIDPDKLLIRPYVDDKPGEAVYTIRVDGNETADPWLISLRELLR